MDKKIILAKQAMKEAARTSSRKLPIKNNMRKDKSPKAARDYSALMEKSVPLTIALGVLSVFYPELATLAAIMAILNLAAIIDIKFRDLDPERNSKKEETIESVKKPIAQEAPKAKSYRKRKVNELFIPFDIEDSNGEPMTMTVFPYKKSI